MSKSTTAIKYTNVYLFQSSMFEFHISNRNIFILCVGTYIISLLCCAYKKHHILLCILNINITILILPFTRQKSNYNFPTGAYILLVLQCDTFAYVKTCIIVLFLCLWMWFLPPHFISAFWTRPRSAGLVYLGGVYFYQDTLIHISPRRTIKVASFTFTTTLSQKRLNVNFQFQFEYIYIFIFLLQWTFIWYHP